MKESTIVKLAAIAAIVILEVVNLLTLKADGNLLLTLGAIVGGIAGYEFGRKTSQQASN